jgi:AraC family transcriptional regulator
MGADTQVVPVRGIFKQRRVFRDFALLETVHSPGSRLKKHRHDSAFFTVVVQGTYYETCQGSEGLCNSNTVRYLPADEAHGNDFGMGCVCLNVELFPHFHSQIRPLFAGCKAGEIQHTMAQCVGAKLWSDFTFGDNLTEFAVLSAVFDLAGLLRRRNCKEYASTVPWLEHVREYLAAHCTTSLRLTDLTDVAGRHPVHVSREFRRFFGKTMAQFVRERRVIRAAEMLRHSEYSIADVSLNCGFYDQSHFTNVFRHHLGCTPAHYRANSPRLDRSQSSEADVRRPPRSR